MKNRVALVLIVGLTALVVGQLPAPGAEEGTPTANGLIEAPSPIIVEQASVVIGGPEFVPDPEVQEAMEEHAADLRARREAAASVRNGLPAAFAAAVGGMSVSYDPANPAPPSVKAVIDAAVAHWDSVIATNGSGPIVVEVAWSSLGNPSLLGYAGPDGMFMGGSLPTDALYPAALTNTLLGIDANGASRPEIQVVLNAELLATNRWYLGTTGTPPGSQIDLYSVVLHEIGHGLGFLGSARIPNGQTEPDLSDPLYIYDTLTRHGSTDLASTADRAQALRSGDVHADVSESVDYELYAPSSFSSGSSFSHFDETQYPGGTAGALMTPMLGSGESARILDSPTLGLLAQMGWPLTVGATTPTITSASPSQAAAVLSWDQNLWQTGVAPDRYVVEGWRGGSLDSSATVDGTATGAFIAGLVPGSTYTIKVVPWGPNGNGTAASTSLQIPEAAGPADPDDWPSFVRTTALDSQVLRLYQAYFLRLPELGGFDYWRDQRAHGVSLIDISAAFASSQEFQDRYGSLSDGTFVDLVYANVLGRAADSEGRSHWLSLLQQGMARGEVMAGFAESAEYIGRTQTVSAPDAIEARITRLYQAFFGRDPDAEGLAHWAELARSGLSLEVIASSFAESVEFQQRYGSLSDTGFVSLVYANVLDRSADAEGVAYWTGQLAAGVSRGTVMVGFSESAEFVVSTGTVP